MSEIPLQSRPLGFQHPSTVAVVYLSIGLSCRLGKNFLLLLIPELSLQKKKNRSELKRIYFAHFKGRARRREKAVDKLVSFPIECGRDVLLSAGVLRVWKLRFHLLRIRSYQTFPLFQVLDRLENSFACFSHCQKLCFSIFFFFSCHITSLYPPSSSNVMTCDMKTNKNCTCDFFTCVLPG